MKYADKKVWNFLTHNLCKALAVGCMMAFSFDASAVTENEMNQAEAIAAKYYIRYVNNMAGYLDTFDPSSMSDLESHLANDKDRESFREFKKSSVPSDYGSWDKDKLVEYWSVTFFRENAGHLDPKGANNGEAKLKIKRGVSSIQIAPPAPEPEPEPAPAPEPEPEMPTVTDNTPYDPLAGKYVDENQQEELLDEMAALKDSLDSEEAAPAEEKKSSGTWVYIMVLSILVVIVVALVAYASRTMKNSKKNRYDDDDIDDERGRRENPVSDRQIYGSPEPAVGYGRSVAEEARMRERYAQSLAEKSEEIRQLTRQLSDMEMLAGQLREENRILKLELDSYRSAAGTPSSHPTMTNPSPVVTPGPVPHQGTLHEVYLGRVNSRGIFVRADRQPVEGQSIFKLSTSNGLSGSFSVINNPYLDRQLISDPEKWLAGGCFANDLYDTAGRYGVLTETPGTAVFKDGAWRVERKAKIRYE